MDQSSGPGKAGVFHLWEIALSNSETQSMPAWHGHASSKLCMASSCKDKDCDPDMLCGILSQNSHAQVPADQSNAFHSRLLRHDPEERAWQHRAYRGLEDR